ncbi:MAG: hypothetical protein MZW92_78970 [Comamonadaceae bacterium]|nr:hypothetical protein [Comamonadaceae bacterium]
MARASRMGDRPGGQFDIPRDIIRAVANNFHEMDAGHHARDAPSAAAAAAGC